MWFKGHSVLWSVLMRSALGTFLLVKATFRVEKLAAVLHILRCLKGTITEENWKKNKNRRTSRNEQKPTDVFNCV